MSIKNHNNIEAAQAVGNFVIIDAGLPAKMGEEITSPMGIVTGKRVAGEVSQWGEVVSVGESVTKFEVGDLVAMPLMTGGSISRVPHPDFVAGMCTDTDSPTNLVVAHEDVIRIKYNRKP
ncbi:head assembly cochaperone [Paraglaciecola Antarctic GD virus 1]|nr:head assembly cochaperone [Paraglaciecola Antarctic GD virus 1]